MQVCFLVRKIPCRRAWQPTPVFLPGESQGQRILVGSSPWGRREPDMTEHSTAHRTDTEKHAGDTTWEMLTVRQAQGTVSDGYSK